MNIDEMDVKKLKNWFLQYTKEYLEMEDNINIKLKIEHTLRVSSDILVIGKMLGLKKQDLLLAEIMGLLHDIARFEQYKQYRTFMDKRSFDHAKMAVKIIRKKALLKNLPLNAAEIILKSILYHNRLALPKEEDPTVLFFSKMLRDADKLDIFKIVTDYYQLPADKRNSTLELELPDTPGFTENVYQQVKKGIDVDYNLINCFNDFKLLQAGWVYSIYFTPTLILLKKRGYLSILSKNLPADLRIDELFSEIDSYIISREVNDSKTYTAQRT